MPTGAAEGRGAGEVLESPQAGVCPSVEGGTGWGPFLGETGSPGATMGVHTGSLCQMPAAGRQGHQLPQARIYK